MWSLQSETMPEEAKEELAYRKKAPSYHSIKHSIPVTMKKSLFSFSGGALLSFLVLVLLLTHPALAFSGASRGLLLWFQTVLPALLPFMVCSNLAVACGAVPLLILPFRRFLNRAFGLTDYGCYTLLSGLLCGYPLGAKTCGEFLESGRLSTSEARVLLAISNHPSPMFLLGYAAAFLKGQVPLWQMFCALYLPILPMGLLARKVYGHTAATLCGDPDPGKKSQSVSFDRILLSSFEVMVKIGGYIMAFSILAAFIESLPCISPKAKAAALSLVEITTGIQAAAGAFTGSARGILITAAIAFGGFSGIFQTQSVLKASDFSQSQKAGLSIRHYLLWKSTHAVLAGLCCLLLQRLF